MHRCLLSVTFLCDLAATRLVQFTLLPSERVSCWVWCSETSAGILILIGFRGCYGIDNTCDVVRIL